MIRNFNEKDFEALTDIFWLTSAKTDFESSDAKLSFQKKYLDDYLFHDDFIGLVYLEDDKVVGYIVGLLNLKDSYIINHNMLKLFHDDILPHSTELHINFHPKYQGGGKGSKLISEFEKLVKSKNGENIFLITAKDARNVSFYQRNGYDVKSNKISQGSEIIMMSKCVK